MVVYPIFFSSCTEFMESNAIRHTELQVYPLLSERNGAFRWAQCGWVWEEDGATKTKEEESETRAPIAYD